jgi:hypothetical protein
VRTLLVAALASAALLAPSAQAIRLPRPSLPPGWSHAEVNVVIKRVPHTLTYDRGRVAAVTPSSVTLRERDGSLWTIPVTATTIVKIDGQPSSIAQVRRLETASTVRIDGGAAAALTVQIPPGLAAAIARQARKGATTG